MIELSSSWELQGRRKLSDILLIRLVKVEELTCDGGEDGKPNDLAGEDASAEFASKPVILQPYLHPEVSSAGPCCILIRLSTHRPMRIVQLVLITSAPHIDLVDRYGETLARIEGVPVAQSTSKLFRCSSGRLSPHKELVLRFAEAPQSESVVIQHIGVYTVCPVSTSGGDVGESGDPRLSAETESHTHEVTKLSSFLGSVIPMPSAAAAAGSTSSLSMNPISRSSQGQTLLRHSNLLFSRSTLVDPASVMVSQRTQKIDRAGLEVAEEKEGDEATPTRGKSASSPAVMSAEIARARGGGGCGKGGETLQSLCGVFLSAVCGNEHSVEFWKRTATCLFASLVQLSLGNPGTPLSTLNQPPQTQDLLQHLRAVFEAAAVRQQREAEEGTPSCSHSQGPLALTSPASSSFNSAASIAASSSTSASLPTAYCRPEDCGMAINVCTLSSSLNEIRQTVMTQMEEVFRRLNDLESKASKQADSQVPSQSDRLVQKL